MKTKQLLYILLIFISSLAKAQIPNNSFEILNNDGTLRNWGNVYLYSMTYDSITNTFISDSIVVDNQYYAPTTDAHTGTYAMELRNAYNYTSNHGIAGSASPDTNDVFSAWGSTTFLPLTTTPVNLNFYYKYFPVNNDSAIARLTTFDSQMNITGTAEIILTGTIGNYTLASIPINFIGVGTSDFYSLNFSAFYTADPLINQPSFGTRLIIDDVSFDATTGIEDNNKEKINIYPNPASNRISVKTDSKIIEINAIDVLGKIAKLDGSNPENIDIHQLSKGVYMIKIKTSTGLVLKKVLVQ